MSDVSIELLRRLDKPLPRYTSYPTAPEWHAMESESYLDALKRFDQSEKPLSLYVHIPFCRSMCLFCGCSVILNRLPENEERYVQYLLQEIALVRAQLSQPHCVRQLHFGGGTPTKLSEEQLGRIVERLRNSFILDAEAEMAIEIDPRTVVEDNGRKLRALKQLGFNRVSFGVQDTDLKVQEAIHRRQSYAVTRATYHLARELGFKGINVDLIYGLPFQTVETFRDTIAKIAELKPDRIALFSYAKIPWLKPHQKAISDETLPSTEEKLLIYILAREHLLAHGYRALGMDHFALENDEITHAFESQTLHRNFQGYTVRCADDMIGFGVTAIGHCSGGYFQNMKELSAYYGAIERGVLPIHRGKVLTGEDLKRQWVIQSLMCRFELQKAEFSRRFGSDFDLHFAEETVDLQGLVDENLITNGAERLVATPTGRLFIRNIAAVFDIYLRRSDRLRFSRSV